MYKGLILINFTVVGPNSALVEILRSRLVDESTGVNNGAIFVFFIFL